MPSIITATPPHEKKHGVILIPWDPESPEHVERLYQQRVACGWCLSDVEEIWRDAQRRGKKAIHWIVLVPSTIKESLLTQHTTAHPLESVPLSDTALSLGGKPRTPPSSSSPFIPVGHISLDEVEHMEDAYLISSFYVSRAIQNNGLGGAALKVLEQMATSEPLNAKLLRLNTIANEYEGKAERMLALGRKPPKVSNHDWYARRGYTPYGRTDGVYPEIDKTGKVWLAAWVHMEKRIV